MKKFLFLLPFLALSPLSMPLPQADLPDQNEARILQSFKQYCAQCHAQYGVDPLEQRREALLEKAEDILARLDLEGARPMPPKFSPLYADLLGKPELLQNMKDYLLNAEPPPQPFDPENPANNLHLIRMPDGYKIEVLSMVPGARSLSVSPSGKIFVGNGGFSNPGRAVYVIANGKRLRLSNGLTNPNGVAFRKADGNLYVAEPTRILVFEDVETKIDRVLALGLPLEMDLRPDGVLPVRFPRQRGHAWKFIRFDPTERFLYVPVGAPCNICLTPGSAAIYKVDMENPRERVMVAEGVRNTVGFDFEPGTNKLWFTDNGRDNMRKEFLPPSFIEEVNQKHGGGLPLPRPELYTDFVPPDELNRLDEEGQHFGYPYCHGRIPELEAGGSWTVPGNEEPGVTEADCDGTGLMVKPQRELGSHVAALGMRFYNGDMFPTKGQIFIAEHGSWNRSKLAGYQVTVVNVQDGQAVSYEPFAKGWLQGQRRWGRPVDVAVMPDGSLLVSDDHRDHGGAVYRITYEKPE